MKLIKFLALQPLCCIKNFTVILSSSVKTVFSFHVIKNVNVIVTRWMETSVFQH